MQIKIDWIKSIFRINRYKILLTLVLLFFSLYFSKQIVPYEQGSGYLQEIYGFPLKYTENQGNAEIIYLKLFFNVIFWYFIASLTILILRIDRVSVNQFFSLSRNKFLLALFFLYASTVFFERNIASIENDGVSIYNTLSNGFPLAYSSLGSEYSMGEISYKLILNFIFWYFIAGLLFLKYPVLAIRDTTVKSWHFVKASIPSFVLFSLIVIYNAPWCSRSFMVEYDYNKQVCISGYIVGGLALLFLIVINLTVVHFLRSEKRKAFGAFLSMFFGFAIYFLLTIFQFNETSTYFYLAYYFPPTLFLIAGIYYFWKKV